jgi:hypothetical protein
MDDHKPELIAMIQTTWPHIRVDLYKREDGLFQFIEEGQRPDGDGSDEWVEYRESKPYRGIETAKAAMIEFYAYQVEDEYWVEPDSVTILEAPDFKGPFHPILRLGYPPGDS